uniref:SUI1 domain-containing protein n=1 Tax=Bicosoecida sp. CB-2014 TaxID=1486930 RepID=A0A7S1C5L7_9STRA|mmetsp:Transcript_14591/g.50842  ORF Transcript_14591/g.50842 Transcript_14591/m.50842 type:complete len:229 (+) Transcript_14591:21-707(+)
MTTRGINRVMSHAIGDYTTVKKEEDDAVAGVSTPAAASGGAGGASDGDASDRASAAAAGIERGDGWTVVLGRPDVDVFSAEELLSGAFGDVGAHDAASLPVHLFEERVHISSRQQGRRMLTTVSGLRCSVAAAKRVAKHLKRMLATSVKVQTDKEAETSRVGRKDRKNKDGNKKADKKARKPATDGAAADTVVMVVQGDFRDEVKEALCEAGLCSEENVRFHGVGRQR